MEKRVRSSWGAGVGAGLVLVGRRRRGEGGQRWGWGGWRWGLGVAMYVCITIYIHTVKKNLPAQRQWQQHMTSLWPALKGSLAKVYKPCIRKNCPACARGDKHPAWLLSLSYQGRRSTIYVPGKLVPTIRKAVRNGRRIEQLLYRAGPQIIKNYRKNRADSSMAVPKS